MEAIVQPRLWSDFPPGRDEMFRALHSPKGEHMVLRENFFIETILPKSVIRRLGDEEMTAYRAPFQTKEARLPTLVWSRELPIAGEPKDVTSIVDAYGAWLAKSAIPKLFTSAEPGALGTARASRVLQDIAQPGAKSRLRGIHYVQEDSLDGIGQALARFAQTVEESC